MPPARSIARLAGLLLYALSTLPHGSGVSADQSVLLSEDAAASYVCQHPAYEAHVVSSSPLVVYLAGFLTAAEREHLRAATAHSFARSAVAERERDANKGGDSSSGRTQHRVRTSQSTSVPRDAVVRCLEERALRFQGFLGGASAADAARLEPLQLVKYGRGQHFYYHTDWFTEPRAHATAARGGNRASSFFAYVRASDDLRGGGTNFPLLTAPFVDDEPHANSTNWCRYIDCDEPWDRGVTFRPVEGNAVYWDNLLPGASGDGDQRTLHAGLPVVRGEKIGLNIWTRQLKLPVDVRGE